MADYSQYNGTKWEFNDELTMPSSLIMLSAQWSFTCDEVEYTTISITPDNGGMVSYGGTTSRVVYYNEAWIDNKYKTIEIGTVTFTYTTPFFDWLEENATQIIPEDIVISYKGQEIASTSYSGTKIIGTAGTWLEDDITIEYTRPSGGGTSMTVVETPDSHGGTIVTITGSPISLQSKSVTPEVTAQTITADTGYDGLSQVDISAMPSGTAGTPTATKGTVSNNSISVTPSVTNTTGYITGGMVTGTAVTVSASELVSGTKTISASGTTDVTNYASASVAAGSATTPATTITANPTISVSNSGLITASVSGSKSVTPTVSAGYISSGTSGTVTVSGSNTSQLTTQAAQTITPTTTDQTIASGKYLTGTQTIKGDANLIAGNIASGVTIFGVVGTHSGGITPTGTFNVSSAGTFDVTNYASISVPTGTATTPATTITKNPLITVNSSGLITATVEGTQSITPTVSAGYVTTGTQGTITVSGTSIRELTVQAEQTITPTTTNQTIASQTYLTGTQTILGDENLLASNIASGITIFGVVGTHSGGNITTEELSITSNGTYTAPTGKAYTPVTVNVPVDAGWETAPESYVEALVNKTITEASGSMVINIRPYAFYSCSSLATISFPNCQFIGHSAFQYCSKLTEIYFPKCSIMSSYAFQWCASLVSASFPNCISIGYYAFGRCSELTTISFPRCSNIAAYAFQSCINLSFASFPNCLFIGNGAFSSCTNLISVYFPNCLSLAGCFSGCTGLTEAVFPKCSSIYSSAFYNCTNLTMVSFPVCRSIGSSVFYNCFKLESVYILAKSVPILGLSAFTNTPITNSTYLGYFGSIYVLSNLLDSYKVATNWSAFADRFVGV